jgi:hypothetical protein
MLQPTVCDGSRYCAASAYSHSMSMAFRCTPTTLDRYRGLSAAEMQARMDAERFDALLSAANRYGARHIDIKALTPLEVRVVNDAHVAACDSQRRADSGAFAQVLGWR